MKLIQLFILIFLIFDLCADEVRLLENGELALSARIESIENAEKEIFIETYYLENDFHGNGLIKNLIDKKLANSRIDIRITLDDFGSSSFPKSKICALKMIGIPVHYFNPVKIYRPKVSQHRDHRKIWYTDKSAIIGGRNISDSTFSNEQWDWDIEVVSSKTEMLRETFLEQWENSKELDCQKIKTEWPMNEALVSKINLDYKKWHTVELEFGFDLGRKNHKKQKTTNLNFLESLTKASKSLVMETGFFTPNKLILEKLLEAKNRGVQNELIINSPSFEYWTEEISTCASLSYQKGVLKNHLSKLYYPQKKYFTHGKAILIDDEVFYLGSFNMHMKSFYWNAETWSVIKNIPAELLAEIKNEFNFRKNNVVRVNTKDDFFIHDEEVSKAKILKCKALKFFAPILHPFI